MHALQRVLVGLQGDIPSLVEENSYVQDHLRTENGESSGFRTERCSLSYCTALDLVLGKCIDMADVSVESGRNGWADRRAVCCIDLEDLRDGPPLSATAAIAPPDSFAVRIAGPLLVDDVVLSS